MESEVITLTKAQVAGVVATELKRNYLWMQCLLLSIIGLIIINLVPGELTQVINLIIFVGQLVCLYFMYNSNKNKIREFASKYGVC